MPNNLQASTCDPVVAEALENIDRCAMAQTNNCAVAEPEAVDTESENVESTDFDLKVMNGWWSNTYYDHVKWVNGLNELKITQEMAEECAQGGQARSLDLMLYSGSCTIKSVYYEE